MSMFDSTWPSTRIIRHQRLIGLYGDDNSLFLYADIILDRPTLICNLVHINQSNSILFELILCDERLAVLAISAYVRATAGCNVPIQNRVPYI